MLFLTGTPQQPRRRPGMTETQEIRPPGALREGGGTGDRKSFEMAHLVLRKRLLPGGGGDPDSEARRPAGRPAVGLVPLWVVLLEVPRAPYYNTKRKTHCRLRCGRTGFYLVL